jgi:hypothetical protein
MNGFGEQIAVLDGITIAPGGGNYGGGSSYPDEGRWPLLPSNAGLNALAAHDDLMGAANNVYNKRVFASFSGGANMSGGSSYPDRGGFPVWAQGGAGMAGLGTMPNVLPTARIFASASRGANMSGGSSFPDEGRFPLLSSTVGLSGCGCNTDGMGAVPSLSPQARAQSMRNIQLRSQQMVNLRRALAQGARLLPLTRQRLQAAYMQNLAALTVLRSRVGLPTLPESQQLVARMKVLQNRRAR